MCVLWVPQNAQPFHWWFPGPKDTNWKVGQETLVEICGEKDLI